MKNKKIIASITAMSVIAMSSVSFAAVTIKDSTITTFTSNKAGVKVKFEGSTKLGELVAEKALEIDKSSNANLSTTKVSAKADIDLGGVKVKEINTATGVVVKGNDPSNEPKVDTDLDETPAEK